MPCHSGYEHEYTYLSRIYDVSFILAEQHMPLAVRRQVARDSLIAAPPSATTDDPWE